VARSIKLANKRRNRAGPFVLQDMASEVADVSSKDVYDWIGKVVAKKNAKTGKAICPFAKRTLQEKKIQVVPGRNSLLDQINHCAGLFGILNLDIVIIYINYPITERRLSKICEKSHQSNPDYAILYDHPDNAGLHQGVSFSFGRCPLVFIQNLKKLKTAQKQLRKTDWYKTWDIEPDDAMFY